MRVFTLRIGLPDFDYAIRHRLTIAVENAPYNFDYFSRNQRAQLNRRYKISTRPI